MAVIPDILCNQNHGTHPKWSAAFARGCGGRITSGPHLVKKEKPIALFGSPFYWSSVLRAQRLGVTWFYGDHAYFRRRLFYRCTKNAFQLGPADFEKYADAANTDPARFLALGVPLLPWRTSGRHVLLCPPDSKFAALHGFDAAAWERDTLDAIRTNTDRVVRTRARSSKESLVSDLENCWALVTHSSNVAVDAITHGVPAVCLNPCAASVMSADSLTQIESPPTPDRFEWASVLANNQWTLHEMKRGQLWKTLGV